MCYWVHAKINLFTMKVIKFLRMGLLLFPLLSFGQGKTILTYGVTCLNTAKAGDSIQVVVTINIEPGWHVYAPLEVNKLQRMQVTQVQFGPLPAGFKRKGALLVPAAVQQGAYAVYKGENHRFIQTFLIDKKAQTLSIVLKGKLTYQACNDLTCYPPITEKFEKQIEIHGFKDISNAQFPSNGEAAWAALQKATNMFPTDADYEAYSKLSPLAMKRFEDRHSLATMQLAASFLQNFPSGPKKKEAITIYLSSDPYFISEIGNEALDTIQRQSGMDWRAFMRSIVVDTAARNEWLKQGDRMIGEILLANIAEGKKENAAFLLFARDFRLAGRNYGLLPRKENESSYWLSLEERYWQPFYFRFQKHMERFAGHPKLADRAKDFLASLKSRAPAVAANYWKLIYQATMPGINQQKQGLVALHGTATEQLQALQIQVGEKPLSMSFTTLDKKSFELEKLRGKIVVIDFWASWCAPCIAELPHLRELYDKYKNKGLEIAGICLDDEASLPKVKEILKKNKVSWPQRFEGKGFDSDSYRLLYGINSLPTVWVVDPSGKIISSTARGAELETLINDQLANIK